MTVQFETLTPTPAGLGRYGSVPIAFVVTLGRTGAVKDYDAIPGHRPADWPGRFDLRRWRFTLATVGGRPVGGAAVVVDPAEVTGPAHRPGGAVLWDLRVSPDHRRRGIGRQLLAAAEAHARAAGRQVMAVETQDVNAVAGRFYAAAGYALASVHPFGYPAFPDEVQQVWSKSLDPIDP